MNNLYTKEYYETSNYSDYKERGTRYFKLAKETTGLLNSIGLIHKLSFVTDFGCATGHLISGLKELGYFRVNGVEISDWARSECEKKSITVFKSLDEWEHLAYEESDIVYALDVLEHMNDQDASKFFESTKDSKLILRIPVASKHGGDFHLEISKKDPTHINCKTKLEWVSMIERYRGCNSKFLWLNLNTIYDSDGVMAVIVI